MEDAKKWHQEKLLRASVGTSALAQWRHRTNQWYESTGPQLFVGFLIVCSFIVDIAEAEIVPAEGSEEEFAFLIVSIVFTSLFTIELVINLFARSKDFFRPFFADYWYFAICDTAQLQAEC